MLLHFYIQVYARAMQFSTFTFTLERQKIDFFACPESIKRLKNVSCNFIEKFAKWTKL